MVLVLLLKSERRRMNEITTFAQFEQGTNLQTRLRNAARKAAIAALSLNRKIDRSSGWIRLPYYHHVFDDEKGHFERQLKHLKNFGDFISMDDVHELISGAAPLNGRYFCVSFDDGFANCYSNMLDITASLDVPVIIYLPTSYIGLNAQIDDEREQLLKFFPDDSKLLAFLTWEECAQMLSHKVTFGSHTHSHANLTKIGVDEIERELKQSKLLIEQKLGIQCKHFACPWGRTNLDFDPEVAPRIAERLGYSTFATTDRGKMLHKNNGMLIKRDHLIAQWENYQLNYFFGE